MINFNEKGKRLGFFLLMFVIFAYLLYVIISYYSAEHKGAARLTYELNDTNIVSTAYATYTVKPDEGSLNLIWDREINVVYPPGALSNPIVLSTSGKTVSDIELELIYDDTNLTADENKLQLVKYDKVKKIVSSCVFRLDTEKNSITADVTGDGIWFVTTPEAIH